MVQKKKEEEDPANKYILHVCSKFNSKQQPKKHLIYKEIEEEFVADIEEG